MQILPVSAITGHRQTCRALSIAKDSLTIHPTRSRPATISARAKPLNKAGKLQAIAASSFQSRRLEKSSLPVAGSTTSAGTAVVSNNQSTIDTAGHFLYQNRTRSSNVIFFPLYDKRNTPDGVLAARELW